MNDETTDPYVILSVESNATPEEIRSRYLNLVREFPPDREPEKFREIHAAYQLLNDPLAQAKSLVTANRKLPDLSAVIAAAEQKHMRLPKLALLALGDAE